MKRCGAENNDTRRAGRRRGPRQESERTEIGRREEESHKDGVQNIEGTI